MGSYAVGSGGSYSKYNYQLPQSGSQIPDQSDGSVQESKSLLSNEDPRANDLPLLGMRDNRVISNKTIQKQEEAAKPKKRNIFQKIGDFFKGIGHGIKNLFKAIINPKNWPLILGAIALTIICPPAGAVLAGVGIAMGGSKMIQGISSGDWEKVGEGTLEVGLSAVGFKGATSGVKTGGAKFTASGTQTANAEKSLLDAQTALSKAKSTNDPVAIDRAKIEVADAEKGLTAAKQNQAQIAVGRMNYFSRQRYLNKNNFESMSPADMSNNAVKAKLATRTATEDLQASEEALKAATKKPDEGDIAKAQTDVVEAQQALLKAKQDEITVLKAQRIRQLQEMGYGERAKAMVKDSWVTTKDSLSAISNKPLTSMDGRTLSYWSRTPKNQGVDVNGETLDTAEQAGTMSSKARNWASEKWNSTSKTQAADGAASGSVSLPKGSMPPTDSSGNNNPAPPTSSTRVQQWWTDRQTQNMGNNYNTALNSTAPVADYKNRRQDSGFAENNPQQFRFESPA